MDTTRQRLAAFMTAPRYSSTWALCQIWKAMNAAGVPLNVTQSVFYHECMQRMLEDAIAKGIDVAVMVDFDSIFTGEDVTQLISRLVYTDHIDALAALQTKRSTPTPLFSKAGLSGDVNLTGEVIEVDTAHFGLTAIKLDRLKGMPKPWFWSQPNEHGEWGDGRTDADVSFWRSWISFGRSIYIDLTTSIGHMEEMVCGFSDTGKHVIVTQENWGLANETHENNEPDHAADYAERPEGSLAY
jgi:hypothetical protein